MQRRFIPRIAPWGNRSYASEPPKGGWKGKLKIDAVLSTKCLLLAGWTDFNLVQTRDKKSAPVFDKRLVFYHPKSGKHTSMAVGGTQMARVGSKDDTLRPIAIWADQIMKASGADHVPLVLPLKEDLTLRYLKRQLDSMLKIAPDLYLCLSELLSTGVVGKEQILEFRAALLESMKQASQLDAKNDDERSLLVAKAMSEVLNRVAPLVPTPVARMGEAAANLDAEQDAHTTSLSTMLSKGPPYLDRLMTSPDRREREVSAAEDVLQKVGVIQVTRTGTKKTTDGSGVTLIKLHLFDSAKDPKAKEVRVCDTLSGGKIRLPLNFFDGVQCLVAHQLKPNLYPIWQSEAMRRFLKEGGKGWCLEYGCYLLDCFKTPGEELSSIRETSLGWFGAASEVPTITSPENELLFLFQLQVVRSVQCRQCVTIQHRMDSLLCTTEMECNGLHLIKGDATKEFKRLAKEEKSSYLRKLRRHTPSLPSPYLLSWSWTNNNHASFYFHGVTERSKTLVAYPEPLDFNDVKAELLFLHLSHLPSSKATAQLKKLDASRYLRNYCIDEEEDGKKKPPDPTMEDLVDAVWHHLGCPQLPSTELYAKKSTVHSLLVDALRPVVCSIHAESGNPQRLFDVSLHDVRTGSTFRAVLETSVDANARGLEKVLANHRYKSLEAINAAITSWFAKTLQCETDAPHRVLLIGLRSGFTVVIAQGLDIAIAKGTGGAPVAFIDSGALKRVVPVETSQQPIVHDFASDFADLATPVYRTSNKSINWGWDDLKRASAVWTGVREGLQLPETVSSAEFIQKLSSSPVESIVMGLDQFQVKAALQELEKCIPGSASWNGVKIAKQSVSRDQIEEGQLSEATLKMLKSKGDVVAPLLMSLRKVNKTLETMGGNHSLMNAVKTSTDRNVHHDLIHTRTITGRLSSANPNCQNVSKEAGIRAMFTSRFGRRKGVIIEADYSQLEVIVLAALSGDTHMMDDLAKRVDFHCKRVALMHPEYTYDEVVRKVKVERDLR